VKLPQPAIANAKTIAIIRNRGLDSEELNGMACRFIISHDYHVELERIRKRRSRCSHGPAGRPLQ
jgi:hypothetical protein